MSTVSRFFPRFDDLPLTLPVFPLENIIVMPGAELQLNIFENRYLNMVKDVLKTHHMFGMVQPDATKKGDPQSLYLTGCAGRITAYSETADGRILLTLTGVIRFDISEELAATRGHRVIVPDWSRYASDLNQQVESDIRDRSRLTSALGRYFRNRNMEPDWEGLERIPVAQLVNTMATLLPIGTAEKQAILEAQELAMREQIFVAALEMSLQEESGAPRH